MNYLLLEILFLPLISAIVLLLFKSKPVVTIRTIAILFGLVSFGLSCKVVNDYLPKVEKQRDLLQQKQTFVPDDSIRLELIRFSPSNPEFPASGALNFYIGIDGLNVFLIPLASGLFLAAIFAAWNSITVNAGIFYMLLALLHFATLGAFLSFDIIQFYMFFEFTLVPLLFLIALWGGANRLYAARKIFIYTLAGGLFTLLGIITLVSAMHQESIVTNHEKPITFSIPELVTASSQTSEILQKAVPETDGKYLRDWNSVQKWIFMFLMIGFAVKVPVVPVNTWQPTGYFEAPTSVTLIMSGILAKLGVFGFIRVCLPILPNASSEFGAMLFIALGVIGVLYGAACAIAQDDIRKMLAYSSLSHLGFCMVGAFSLNETGLSGAIVQMINHGINIGIMFFLCEGLLQRYGTTRFKDLQGLGSRIKMFSGFMVFFVMCSVGLPGLNGFVGEVLCVLGLFDARTTLFSGKVLAGFVSLGMVLGAWYFLGMLMKVFFQGLEEPVFKKQENTSDITTLEKILVIPTALLCLYLGVFPQGLIDTIRPETHLISKVIAKSNQHLPKWAVDSGNKTR